MTDCGWKLVPIKMTAAMLAASKNAMKDYIDRQPPESKRELGRRHGVHVDVKHQIRWAAAIAAAPHADGEKEDRQ